MSISNNIIWLFSSLTFLMLVTPISYSKFGGQSVLYSLLMIVLTLLALYFDKINKLCNSKEVIDNLKIKLVLLIVLMAPSLSLVVNNTDDSVKFIQYIAWLFLLSVWVLYPDSHRITGLIRRLINFALVVHVIIFLSQQILYKFFGVIIDFYQLVFPFSDGSISTSYNAVRMGGLTPEPGAYANIILLLSGMKCCFDQRLTKLSALAVISSILTISGSSIFLVAIFVSSYALIMEKGYKQYFYLFIGIAALFSVMYFSGVFDFIINRFVNSAVMDNSTSYKINNLMTYANSTLVELVFGVGHNSALTGSELGYNHVNSNGNGFNAVVVFGLQGYLLMFSLFALVIKNKYILPLFSIFIFSRYSFSYPIYWCSIIVMIQSSLCLGWRKNEVQ